MVPLLRNGMEVSVVMNTSVSRNTVTNSNVSYTQRLAKDRYALWMDNRCFPSNQSVRVHFWTVGIGDFYSVRQKATLGGIPTPTESVFSLQFAVRKRAWSLQSAASLRAEEIGRQSRAPGVRYSAGIGVARESAIVNTVSVGTVCNRRL
jgi:hypothetical protein